MRNIIVILLLLLLTALYFMPCLFRNYEGFALDQTIGNVNDPIVLLQDTYPFIGSNQLSNLSSNDIWKNYPNLPLGSYTQITNNIKYPDNPDIGTCTPASMCGALYHKKHIGDNYSNILPPVGPGTRVGYFVANR